MGVRQVQVTIRRGVYRKCSVDKLGNQDNDASILGSSIDTGGPQTREDRTDEIMVRHAMHLLTNIRGNFTIMPLLLRADSHSVVQFRSQQKHLEETIMALQGIGIGIDERSRIDINDLQVSIPRLKRAKKKKLYKMSDRMTAEEIFESIDSGSHLTFDYIAMVFVASVIAAVGLISDSSVSVVASMLVSPLMGPILAVTWGIVMRDWNLIRRGSRNEVIGVMICFGVGLLVGAAVGPFFGPANLTVTWATGNLTSFEIASRGSPWSLLSGGVVAIPSGIGVALALTGGGINALVGVAISAALLPPIVNSGLCLSLAFWFEGDPDDYDTQGDLYYRYSIWSFLLFVVNFVLIIFLALGVFKLKKISPHRIRKDKSAWKRRVSTIGKTTNMVTNLLPSQHSHSSRSYQIDSEDESYSTDFELKVQKTTHSSGKSSFDPKGPWGSKD